MAPQATMTNPRDGIARTNGDFERAVRAGDAAGMAACYSSTAMLLPPGSSAIERAGIEAFWQKMLDLGVKGVRLETLEVEQHGDIAHEMGLATILGERDSVLDRGKYLVLWREEGGRWKLHRDIWNTSGST